ncbi:hypothetical protein NNJEOMEG_01419 [Fundidesulfovibrio magnetotacticus]|uniref:Uncharacterized protein n=1 Tax=Fundidesulfovibrio magnetotacticus TaxID=2730080 RepID=A0A6V8LZD1_9BACT|nr:hypothetical protein [Fundidesulfovibrio magnetotacticus]GFK93585.1 hypothetical protein NNJEOMEG_01419 [Fundidesulfovibrio magnetotacticus]
MTMPTYAQTCQAGAQAPWGIDPTLAGEAPLSGPGGAVAQPELGARTPLDDPCIVAFEPLLDYLQRRPAWQAAVEGHPGGLDWDRLLDHGPAPAEPESLARWEGARDALASFKPFLKEREARLSGYIKQRD